MNIAANKTINTDKKWNTKTNKKLNAIANNAIDADKERNATVSKQSTAIAELSMLIKD